MLSDTQTEDFERDGFIIIPDFFAPQEIEPIQRGLYDVIGICMKKYGFEDVRPPFSSENFDSHFPELKLHSPEASREIYDAAKQLFPVFRLFGLQKCEDIFCQLRQTNLSGVGGRSYGMRIDDKASEKLFKAEWHQEYIGHFRSLDGIVLWAPLTPVNEENGSLIVCPGSHKLGPLDIRFGHPHDNERYGNYSIMLDDPSVLDKFEHVSVEMGPRDALFVDYLTLHRSGTNNTDRPRWTMQCRYFNFRDPKGIEIAWKGGLVDGTPLEEVAPELLTNPD